VAARQWEGSMQHAVYEGMTSIGALRSIDSPWVRGGVQANDGLPGDGPYSL
jgi:hypothetical protein